MVFTFEWGEKKRKKEKKERKKETEWRILVLKLMFWYWHKMEYLQIIGIYCVFIHGFDQII